MTPASCATDDDINKTTDDGDICRIDVTEHIPIVLIVEEDATKIADDVIGKVDIVGDVDRTNAADDTIGNCTAVDVDGVNRADNTIGDVTVDTSKGWKK